MKIKISKKVRLSIIVTIIFVSISLIIIVENFQVLPKNYGTMKASYSMYDGGENCLIDGHSDIVIDLSKKTIENKIVFFKTCDFQYGRIFFKISDLQKEPEILGLNYSYINRTSPNNYDIILDKDLMQSGRYDIIIKGEISNRFYKRYDIINNNALPISSIIFIYDNTLLGGGYSCDDCFSLIEGNLIDKGNWAINQIGDIDKKRYLFNDTRRVLFRFNPDQRWRFVWKEVSIDVLIAILAGGILFFLTKNLEKLRIKIEK